MIASLRHLGRGKTTQRGQDKTKLFQSTCHCPSAVAGISDAFAYLYWVIDSGQKIVFCLKQIPNNVFHLKT